jgi:hypothetical protein
MTAAAKKGRSSPSGAGRGTIFGEKLIFNDKISQDHLHPIQVSLLNTHMPYSVWIRYGALDAARARLMFTIMRRVLWIALLLFAARFAISQ